VHAELAQDAEQDLAAGGMIVGDQDAGGEIRRGSGDAERAGPEGIPQAERTTAGPTGGCGKYYLARYRDPIAIDGLDSSFISAEILHVRLIGVTGG
jgi:hypothetical protein